MPTSHNFEADAEGYVNLGDVSRNVFGRQAQYGNRFFDKKMADAMKIPYIGEGLRILGTTSNYHAMKIHKDDIEEAIRRYENRYENTDDD